MIKKTLFLSELRGKKYNYFIDLENKLEYSYHRVGGDKFLCGKNHYSYQYEENTLPCLFCEQKMKKITQISVDLLIFTEDYKIDNTKTLLLSKSEYTYLKSQNTYLFLNTPSPDINKIQSLLFKIKDNSNIYLQTFKSYERGVKELMNINGLS